MITIAELRTEIEAAIAEAVTTSAPLVRHEWPVAPLQTLHWLRGQPHDIKGYWCDRDGMTSIAAVGEADVIRSLDPAAGINPVVGTIHQRVSGVRGARYFGGFRFGPWRNVHKTWQPFGLYRFILPRFELIHDADGCRFAVNIVSRAADPSLNADRIMREFERLGTSAPAALRKTPRRIGRKDIPDPAGWRKEVEQTLTMIGAGLIDKLVLARLSGFQFLGSLSPLDVLARLQQSAAACYYYCGCHEGRIAMIGASPEQFYSRHGRELESEAVAGTRPRGATPVKDAALEAELIASAKDHREHELVVTSLVEALGGLSTKQEHDPVPVVRKFTKVQHLVTGFRATLRKGVTDADIINSLHPTAAVGGYPREAARDLLADIEPFDRGWYAAPVGWIADDAAEFAVAIRCGVIQDKRLGLFAGAGIVRGSEPVREWHELDDKIAGFLSVL